MTSIELVPGAAMRSMMHRHAIAAAAVLVAAALALSGCGDNAPAPTGITIAVGSEPANLDPNIGGDAIGRVMMAQTFDHLVAFGSSGEIEPALATKWVQDSATQWTLTLRTGVKFTDGTPFDASAVKYDFDRLLNPANKLPLATLWTFLQSVEVVDPTTVRFVLNKPYGSFLQSLGMHAGEIGSPAAYQKNGLQGSSRNPVGTGPWKFVKWDAGREIEYAANSDYWGGTPKLKTAVWKFVSNPQTRTNLLLSGGIDYTTSVSIDSLASLQQNPAVVVEQVLIYNWTAIVMNETFMPFDDVRVRQAICMAIDRQSIQKNIMRNVGKLMTSPLPMGGADQVDQGGPQCTYDPAAAKTLLDKAGGGFSTTLYYGIGHRLANDQVAQAVQAALAKIGIIVQVVSNDGAAFSKARSSGTAPMWIGGWGSNGDPHASLYSQFLSTQAPPNGSNDSRYANPDLDKVLEQGSSTADPNQRKTIYAEAQRLIWQQMPWIYLDQNAAITAHLKKVSGVTMDANQLIDLTKATVGGTD
jgi:peptide/nickel transport system substrate-binding protein